MKFGETLRLLMEKHSITPDQLAKVLRRSSSGFSLRKVKRQYAFVRLSKEQIPTGRSQPASP